MIHIKIVFLTYKLSQSVDICLPYTHNLLVKLRKTADCQRIKGKCYSKPNQNLQLTDGIKIGLICLKACQMPFQRLCH